MVLPTDVAYASYSSSASRTSCYVYALDVLTDGSEGSYAGIVGAGATIFLSVHKKPSRFFWKTGAADGGQQEEHDGADGDSDYDSGVVARYALSGIGDLTSRLASDQRLKLGCVRAVFDGGGSTPATPNICKDSAVASTSTRSTLPSTMPLWGLPSLHMALQKAGAATLTVVTPEAAGAASSSSTGDASRRCYVEQVMQLLHSRSTHPTVRTCHVPTPTDEKKSSWWTVYHDELVEVHATSRPGPAVGDDVGPATHAAVVYLYTLRRMEDLSSRDTTRNEGPHTTEPGPASLLVVPPGFFGAVDSRARNDLMWLESILDPSMLPVPPQSIRLGVAVEPSSVSSSFQHVLESLSINIPWIYTSSIGDGSSESPTKSRRVMGHDPFLLVRATREAKQRHDLDPRHFPWSHASATKASPACLSENSQTSLEVTEDRPQDGEATNSVPGGVNDSVVELFPKRALRLRTGHSLMLIPSKSDGEQSKSGVEMKRVDRTRPLLAETSKHSMFDADEVDDSVCEDYSVLDDDPPSRSDHRADGTVDDNQIDLDGCLEEEEHSDCGVVLKGQLDPSSEDIFHVELLCMGTGCAAPSPFRGASGYAILLNPWTSVVMDAGEGFVTQWNRHAQHRRCLSSIRIICISHAQYVVNRSDPMSLAVLWHNLNLCLFGDSWDHFGGLVPLLTAIHHAQSHEGVANARDARDDLTVSRKRPRLTNGGANGLTNGGANGHRGGNLLAPLLLAPDRVLQYVAMSLDSFGGGSYTPISLQRRDFSALLSRHLSAWSREACGIVSLQTNHPDSPHSSHHEPRSAFFPSVPTILTLDKVRVDHCPHSYGFVLAVDRPTWRLAPPKVGIGSETSRPFLVCYSGDTRPCQSLVQACHFYSDMYGRNGLDFLLHEATFSDHDVGQCAMKCHSTVSDAVEVSRRVLAGRTLLTHFSQRYSCRVRCSYVVGRDATSGLRNGRDGYDNSKLPTRFRVKGAVDGLQIRL